MAEFLHGLDRLHVPRAFTAIASFMVRYMDVVADDVRRMRVARLSRGYERRWIWQARAIGQTAGALFIRSYERGERVYLAMLSRGYSGTMPDAGRGGRLLERGRRPASCPSWRCRSASSRGCSDDRTDGRTAGRPFARGERPRLRLPRWHASAVRRRPHGRRGERVALLGPNGAGKTTLALHLNGVHEAQSGTVRVGGLPVVKEHLREVRRRVGIVFQDPDDQLFMPTVRDDVAFGPANLGLRGDELEVESSKPSRRRHGEPSPTARHTISASASVDGSPWRPCSRCAHRSWCSTSRRRTSTPQGAGSSPTS